VHWYYLQKYRTLLHEYWIGSIIDLMRIIMSTVDITTYHYDLHGRSERFPYGEERAHNQQGTSLLLVRPTANSSCCTTESVSCFGFGDVRQMAMRTGSTDRRISSVPVNSLLDRQIRWTHSNGFVCLSPTRAGGWRRTDEFIFSLGFLTERRFVELTRERIRLAVFLFHTDIRTSACLSSQIGLP